ncbi:MULTISPECIES: hypothetical protein [unclassified Frondihabitans]|uniref:hypothetical protein n=1 Tax=unclassified Frondihabitans TaxID=2626248 RepID=UPI000F4D621F|nr:MULTISPECIES: hypothetical protein [unclassified Frondihabitans]
MDYAVAYTACTSGGKARDRFRKDIVPVLEKVYPDPDSRPFKIRKAGGSERIEFDNGSIFQVLPPMGESYRGDSFDLVILDEAGEATAAMTEDLLGAILPTTDTREDAQIIVAGTAAPFRDGNLLWDTLKDGRDGKASTAIIEYAAPDSTNMDDLEDWDLVVPLVLAAHPGIGTLTTLEKMQANYEKITPAQFAAEYLSIFGNSGAATGLINSQLWTLAGDDGALPSVPDTFGLAMSVHPDGLGASLAAAWRVDGVAHVGLLWHSTRPAGLVARALAVAREHRVAIVHDGQASATTVEADILARERPRPRMAPQLWGPVSTAASLFVKELDAMNMRHYSQPAFDEAVRVAVKRGTATSNKWGFGRPRKDPSADITPLEAAALALYYYDEAKPRPKLKPSFG